MANAQISPYEKDNAITVSYQELMDYYRLLDTKYVQMQLLEYGQTDIGKPLNLIVLSADKIFDPAQIRKQNKRIILINNGIHPGEPEGIDASMILVRDLLEKNSIPKNVVICIIPIYNVDGMLNRGQSRVNQNGPESYGFRGNYQNLDLNRDFIKADSRNSRVFQMIFNTWQPEVFIDNHTSNGADYQYIMTLIAPQKDKLNPVLSEYLSSRMLPDLYKKMKSSNFEMTPYVNNIEETPDSGITGFLETPRYSTGYAALHNTIGFMPETHMLKSYPQRVEGTYKFMEHVIEIVKRDADLIATNKQKADADVRAQVSFPLQWTLDDRSFSLFRFKGYMAKYKTSEVSGIQRLYYDRNEPYEKDIRIFDHYIPLDLIKKPFAYIIPQSWQKVIDLMLLNNVQIQRLVSDMEIDSEMYYIEDYKTVNKPFEGHYLHSQVKLRTEMQSVKYYEGDYIIYTDQVKNRYIVETLEPQGVDSFFAWNFFDSVLGQKEHFSDYVFEDEAARLLKQDPELMVRLEEEKKINPELLQSPSAQLDWVYRNSKHYERTHMRYPVGRLISPAKIELN
ncbi:M14 family metallopeptidase [Daejeonella sp.]|uniref:M14 family metallopeptidase n=1 Tax=Daejeonella sp. TaxID=2805397 RepID=UPI002732CAD6|nr:M14 family metallopeptidase [Daejeonella sp.]